MLALKMAVSFILGWSMLYNSVVSTPDRLAVIDAFQQEEKVNTTETEQELNARVNDYTRIYRVETGDTLERIARRYQTDPELVAVMNYMELGTELSPGQLLILPFEADKKHTVVAGDTLWGLSNKYGVSVAGLQSANGIIDPRSLQIGTVLTIPGTPEIRPSRSEIVSVSRGQSAPVFMWPLNGAITSGFGWRNNEFHHGLDIAGDNGDKIRAAAAGEVVFSGWHNGIYGRIVRIDHGNGLETLYAHNSRNLVKVGEYVEAGDYIAEVGDTGRTTGPHLHFGVLENDKPVNPERYLR